MSDSPSNSLSPMLRWPRMRSATRSLLVMLLVASAACAGRSCTTQDASPFPGWRRVKGADGQEYRLVERGAYRAYYDPAGRLQRIEYDSNGDGRPDHFAHHDGAPRARLLEVDTSFDGKINRWEHYDSEGRLVKVGSSTLGERPERWAHLGNDGLPVKVEHDADRDGNVERVEVLLNGRLVRVEVDADRDGRLDRWQDWHSGVLAFEDLDTDGDGKPDRRLRYGTSGEVETLEPLKHE